MNEERSPAREAAAAAAVELVEPDTTIGLGSGRGLWRVVELIGERLGIGIANAINAFDPEVVAVGGGVSAAGDLLLAPARSAALRFVLPGVGAETEIRLARHGGDAGLLGAALLARQELELEAPK